MYGKCRLALQVCTFAVIVSSINAGQASAQAESAVRGQVVAAADGSALAEAAVTLKPVATDESVLIRTDASGRFTFPSVSAGEYILSAASEGFRNRELRFMLAPREVQTVTMSLEVGGLDVSVDVAGDLPSLPGTYSPSSTALTSERIEKTPVFQRTTLPDAIVTAAPGMIRGHDDFVHIRGHEVALNPLINGVSFWENTHSLFSAGLSPDVIETANVMTGGFPAEYGNRFGGVVDIVTRSGLRMENRGAVTVSAGDAGRRRVGGEFGGNRGGFGYFLFGSLFESDRFLSPPDPEAIHDEGRGGHAFVQLEGSLGRPGSVRAVVMGDGTSFEIPNTPSDVILRPLATARQDTRQQTVIVGWMKALGDVAVSASVYQRWSRARLFPAEGPLTARADLDRRLFTIGGKSDATRFMGRHALKAGIDAVRLRPREDLAYSYGGYREFTHVLGLPHIHVEGDSINFSGAESGGQVSAYIQDGIQVGSRMTADVGLRVDRYDLLVSKTHASPRVNLAFRLDGGTVLHTSYNHFFVPPPIEGALSSSAGLTQSIEEIGVALPPLEPTVEDQFEVGITTPLGPFQTALTSYYRATDNPVHTTVWPDSRIYSYASFDRARAYGLEAKAEVTSLVDAGITGYLNYALGRVYFYNPATGGFLTEAAHLTETSRFLAPMDQTHTLTGGATYRHTGTGVWLGGMVEYGSGTPMGHGGADHEHAEGDADHAHVSAAEEVLRVPGHFTANLSFGVELWRSARSSRLSLQFDVENITDNSYLVAQEGVFSPAQYAIPRLVAVTAKVRF